MQRGTRHTARTRRQISEGVKFAKARQAKLAQQRASGMTEAEIAASIIKEGLKILDPGTARAIERILAEGRRSSHPRSIDGVEIVGR